MSGLLVGWAILGGVLLLFAAIAAIFGRVRE